MMKKKDDMMKLYKVISKDGLAHNGGNFDYKPYFPKGKRKGKWTPRIKNINKCYYGYHVTPYWNMWLKSENDLIFEVECKGLKEDNFIGVIDKYVAESIRLIKQRFKTDPTMKEMFDDSQYTRMPQFGNCKKCGKHFNQAPEGTSKLFYVCEDCRKEVEKNANM